VRFMQADRETADRLVPGLATALSSIPLQELESDQSPAIDLFRAHGGTNLLVPQSHGGSGASALDAVRVARALGALAPSMAVGTMMHHFSIGTLFAIADTMGAGTALDDILLKRVGAERLLVASGFAEGRTDQGILTPTMVAEPIDGGFRLNGAKKPCSLARSMDLLTASVGVTAEDGSVGMGFLLLPADTDGLTVQPFWSTFALGGAQSHEVRLTGVEVTADQVILPDPEMLAQLDELQTVGLIWFQMLVCATYTGIASALVDRVLARSRGSVTDRAAVATEIESAAALGEGLARRVMAGETDNDALAAALVSRFAVQDAVSRAVGRAVELLGGMAYVSSPDVAYLAAASHAIAFHPPSRSSTAGGLLDYYAGEPLVVS
jgi:alkylation response protein AidB-like acyl-CoA dehydrogenase